MTALAATGLLLSGCTGGGVDRSGEPRQAEPKAKPSYTVQPSTTPAPVRRARRADRVLPGDPLPAPRWRAPERQPNLLMITADDAALGDLEHMPNVRRLLARQGTTVDGLAPTPICVPARASLLTGQYAANHGAVTINGEGGGFAAFEDDDTLPVWLRDAGYDTMFVGKYLNGYGDHDSDPTYVPPGWTDWHATVDPSTYRFDSPRINHDGTLQRHQQYNTDLFADLTVDLLSDADRERKPWYLWVNYVAPHVGQREPDDPPHDKTTVPPPRWKDAYDDLPLPSGGPMFEEDTSDKVLVDSTHRRWSPQEREVLEEARQQRVEAMRGVDDAVARTVRTLRRTGQLDDTYVVFTSDNGYAIGEHNLTGKLWHYRDILHVPMVLRGPDVPRGERVALPVTNPDWATTFAALAGAEPGRPQDGDNVVPWLGSGATDRVVPLAAYPVMGGRQPKYRGVSVGPWLYVEDADGRRREMFYRRVDPHQLSNLARDPRYRDQVRKLRRLTLRYADCAGDTCPHDFWSRGGVR